MSVYFKSILCAIIFCLTCLGCLMVYNREALILNNQTALLNQQAADHKTIQDVVNFLNQSIEAQKQPAQTQQKVEK